MLLLLLLLLETKGLPSNQATDLQKKMCLPNLWSQKCEEARQGDGTLIHSRDLTLLPCSYLAAGC